MGFQREILDNLLIFLLNCQNCVDRLDIILGFGVVIYILMLFEKSGGLEV